MNSFPTPPQQHYFSQKCITDRLFISQESGISTSTSKRYRTVADHLLDTQAEYRLSVLASLTSLSRLYLSHQSSILLEFFPCLHHSEPRSRYYCITRRCDVLIYPIRYNPGPNLFFFHLAVWLPYTCIYIVFGGRSGWRGRMDTQAHHLPFPQATASCFAVK